MILDPINDRQCLDQLTKFARELYPTTLLRMVARRLGSREMVIQWFQSLPQADDLGDEHARFIQCDVPQRARLLPDDPNCVERSLGALMLLEVIDPKTPRALATVDRPLRHTGLVEKHGAHWRAVDLFPRRNARRNLDLGKVGGDVLQGVHTYVGKPVLKFYLGDTGGKLADELGEQEKKALGRDQKKTTEKKAAPPSGSAPGREPNRPGAGAAQAEPIPGAGGGKDGEAKQVEAPAGATAAGGAADARARRPTAADRDGGDSDGVDEGEEAPGSWWFLNQ